MDGVENGQLHRFGKALAGRQAKGEVAPQVALCKRLHVTRRKARQVEQHSRQPGVDLLVRPHVAVAEIEERLPIDEARRRALSATQVVRVGTIGQAVVKYQLE